MRLSTGRQKKEKQVSFSENDFEKILKQSRFCSQARQNQTPNWSGTPQELYLAVKGCGFQDQFAPAVILSIVDRQSLGNIKCSPTCFPT